MRQKRGNIPPRIQAIVNGIDQRIEDHKKAIKDLELTKKAYLKYKPYIKFVDEEPPALTRSTIRDFLKGHQYPVQTVQVIEILYSEKSQEEKNKMVKTLSVIFNQMHKEGEMEIEKKPGVKGNYYRYIK